MLVAGTGLTMADVVVAGNAAAKGKAFIHAISRHGLMPPPQTSYQTVHDERDIGSFMGSASVSRRHLVRATGAPLRGH